jgi:hypothetical protein
MRPRGPVPSLGELQRTTPWVWLWCERRQASCTTCLRRRRHPMGRERIERPATGSSSAAARAVARGRHVSADEMARTKAGFASVGVSVL